MDVRLKSLFPSPVVHPGVVLQVEFLHRYTIPQQELAKAIGVAPANLCTVIHERRPVTRDLGRRLGMALRTPAEFWLLRQLAWDLEHDMPLPAIAPMPHVPEPGTNGAASRSGLYLSVMHDATPRPSLLQASG